MRMKLNLFLFFNIFFFSLGHCGSMLRV